MVRVKHHLAAVIPYTFRAMHYCKRIRMFALQRLAMLLKFTRSQISQPEQLHGSAALLLSMTNSKAVWQLWHSPRRAASRAFAWPILALLTEIKPGTAPGRAFFSVFEGWLDFAPVGLVAETGLHHHCRSGWALVITCLWFFSCCWHFLYLTLTFQLFSGEQPIMY